MLHMQFFKTAIRDLYTNLEAEVSIISSSQLPTHQAFTAAHDNPEANPAPPAANGTQPPLRRNTHTGGEGQGNQN